MKLTFLSAAVPLTKTFTLNNGVLEKQAHPKITSCTSHEEEVSTIEEFKNALDAHAAQGHCLLKGNTNRPLVKESRANSTDPHQKTSFVILDIDRLKGCKSVDDLLKLLGIDKVDHIIQYSSSMGVVPDSGLSAHVVMLLKNEAIPEFLKRWLVYENLTKDILIDNLNLTRTGNALRWGLDVTTCQNDKLIYIAPPILGKGVKDDLSGDRIVLVKRSLRTLEILDGVPPADTIRDLTQKGLNLIRSREGLPERELTTKRLSNIEYVANPDKAQVTGTKEDGPFIHLNLNGGDSWAYWHLKSHPDFIHNFKGEPSYKTSELLPEYWETVRPVSGGVDPNREGTQYFVFCNKNTASYHKAIWTPEQRKLELYPAKSKGQLSDFLENNNQPHQKSIPDWSVKFDPQSSIIVDTENRIINEFQANDYMMMAPSKSARVPPTIHKTLWNVLGSDQETYEYYLNWMAVIWQYRCKAETAWLVYGTTGTGKGTLCNLILAPLFKYVSFVKSRDLMSIYNEFLEKSLILVVDEAELGGKNGGSIVESDMKNFITEPTISIRRMHMAPYMCVSFVNAIFNANVNIPLRLNDNDRRMNVAPFQRNSIVFKTGERESIKDQLPEMAQYLGAYPADKDKARKPLMNAARKHLIWMGKAGTDSAITHLKEGDLKFFQDAKQAVHMSSDDKQYAAVSGGYSILVDEMPKRDYLLREEVHLLLNYLMDNIPASPYKFVSFLKHHDLELEDVEHNGKTYKGLKVTWKQNTPSTTTTSTTAPSPSPSTKTPKSGSRRATGTSTSTK